MHYFSFNTPQDEHIGFLVLTDDDNGQGGQFAIRAMSETKPRDKKAVATLSQWEHCPHALLWQAHKDRIILLDNQQEIGEIRQEILLINGNRFILGDLTGAI